MQIKEKHFAIMHTKLFINLFTYQNSQYGGIWKNKMVGRNQNLWQ